MVASSEGASEDFDVDLVMNIAVRARRKLLVRKEPRDHATLGPFEFELGFEGNASAIAR